MIYATMIVGSKELDRYLAPVLERVARWADGIFIAFEPNASVDISGADHTGTLAVSTDENDGMAKNEAWTLTANAFRPTEADLMAFVKPTEIIQDPGAVRMAAKEFPESSLAVTLCHLWDEDHIRVDGSWHPKEETVLLPYRRGASYPDLRLRAGRLPSYHHDFPTCGIPVSPMLDYDVMSFNDKLAKLEWLDRVGAEFYPIDHIQSIRRTPTLRAWRKGGVLHVGETLG